MASSQLSITYQTKAAEALDLIEIEQEDWAPYTGVVTRAEMVRYLAAQLYGDEYQSRIDCGLAGGDVVCVIYVYPRVKDLAYQFHTSHGSLSGRSVEMVELEETINFTLTISESPAHPPRQIHSVEWLSECYDPEGGLVDPPALAISGETITIPSPVYGSVTVKYVTERHGYVLNAPRREAAIDDHYSAAVWAVYDGGINWLAIKMPPNIASFEADPDAVCGWSSTGSFKDDEQAYPIADDKHSRTSDVDYCSQQIINEEIT